MHDCQNSWSLAFLYARKNFADTFPDFPPQNLSKFQVFPPLFFPPMEIQISNFPPPALKIEKYVSPPLYKGGEDTMGISVNSSFLIGTSGFPQPNFGKC